MFDRRSELQSVSGAARLRVLHLLNDIEDNGNGIVYSTMELALEQAARGFEVAVGSAGGFFEVQLSEAGIRHFVIPQRSPAQLLANLFKMRSALQTYRPDMLHCHMVSGVLLSLVARQIPGLKTRPLVIAHVRNSWMKHARLMRFADHCIALSESSRDYLLGVGFSAERLSVVRNGSFGSRLRRATAMSGDKIDRIDSPSVVSVCGLYERKGIFDLVEAARRSITRVPDLQFFIIGDGDEKQRLRDEIRRAGLERNFHLLGFRSNIQPILERATVFVLASHDEPFGRVILEARAAGTAIVATDVGGIPEATDGGRCAILVPPRSPEDLANAICDLVQDDAKRHSLIEAGRASMDVWSVARVVREVSGVYDQQLRHYARKK